MLYVLGKYRGYDDLVGLLRAFHALAMTRGGEGGIRTPEAQLSTFLFSRQAHSTTLAPLRLLPNFQYSIL